MANQTQEIGSYVKSASVKVLAFSVKDKGGKREATAKIKGARDLDSLVGLLVTLSRSQKDLPGIDE